MHFLNGFSGLIHTNEPTTPGVMSNNVSRLKSKILPGVSASATYYVFSQPEEFSPFEGECYYNVARMIKENGGEPVFGWMLWESQAMIEGEAHCLYKAPNGEITDITPRVSGEDKILFIPDSDLHPSMVHLGGENFRMTQSTNPQLAIANDHYVASRKVDVDFDQSEIRVIALTDYLESYLFT